MVDVFGWQVWSGLVQSMSSNHQHTEIELNFIEHGAMLYLFGARQYRFAAGQLALFWGATPHQLIDFAPETRCTWITIPLAHFLRWAIPDPFTAQVIGGVPLHIENQSGGDRHTFQRWTHDWAQPDPEYRTIVLLELEARLRRFALDHASGTTRTPHVNTTLHHKVEGMIQLITERYTEPLSVAEIATAVGLHPKYAIQLFRQSIGIGLIDYLTHHRVAHAQRLLATTSRKVIDIALESGFGSASRFYAVFQEACGVSPREYRLSMLP
jgi:AraC family transcriptional regulator, melibiose operon regulatory protein